MKGPPPAPEEGGVDLVLRFSAARDGRSLVRAEPPLGSGVWRDLALPPASDAEALTRRALAAGDPRSGEAARDLARLLAAALLDDEVLGRPRGAFDEDRAAPPLRLLLRLGDVAAETDVHHLPWELLCDPRAGEGRLLPGTRRVSVARHLPLPRDEPPPPRPRRLRVVVAALAGAGGPAEGAALAARARALGAALRSERGVLVEALPEATLEALAARLNGGGFHVLYLLGESSAVCDGDGFLAWGNGTAGKGYGADRSGGRGPDPIRLVVLDQEAEGVERSAGDDPRAGETRDVRPLAKPATALLRRGVPAVVAMQAPLATDAATAFAAALCARLAAGHPLDAAVAAGRAAIAGRRPSGIAWAAPVLFTRLPGCELFAAGVRGGRQSRAERRGEESAGGQRDGWRSVGRRWVAAALASAALGLAAIAVWQGLHPGERQAVAARLAESGADAQAEETTAGARRQERLTGEGWVGESVLGESGPGDRGKGGDSVTSAEPARDGGRGARSDAPPASPDASEDRGAVPAPPPAAPASTPSCAPRTLASGGELSVPELELLLVASLLEGERFGPSLGGLGQYVRVDLLGSQPSHRVALQPAVLDFRPHAPLEVRLHGFDPAAGTIRLSCRVLPVG